MSSLKEKISEAIRKHVSLDDTYTYELTRTKEAFEVGTMDLEDFEEWTDENVDDLTETIVDALQPQLNPNQQIVLSWLKIEHFDSYFKAAVSNLFFYVRHDDIEGFPNLNYRKLVEEYKELSDKEFAQVLEVFSRWAQEREEE